MPSTITHEYFHRDVYAKTSDKFKAAYPEEVYRQYSVGSQGHDALFFYNFWNLPDFMKRRDIALDIQNRDFRESCIKYIQSIIELKQKDSVEAKMLLYGYVLHHILDSHAHPFIIYETEREHLHERVESSIDKLFISARTGEKPSKYPVHDLIPKLPEIKPVTKDIITEAFARTYGLENFGDMYIKALKQVRLFLRLFRYDPTGIKKLGYNVIDKTKLVRLTFSWLSYKSELTSTDYLNLDHKVWGNPIDKTIISTESFFDLYKDAMDEGAKLISNLEEAIKDEAPRSELESIIPDKSAIHGLECGRPAVYTNLR